MTGIRTSFLLVVTTLLLAACGGGDSVSEMRLTLTDDACTYEGDKTPAAGAFTVEVENKSSADGYFSLAELTGGATGDDFEAYLAKVREGLQQGRPLLEPPPFYAQVVRVSVPAGTSSQLPADVPAGKYVLTCFADDPATAIYLGTPLEVSG